MFPFAGKIVDKFMKIDSGGGTKWRESPKGARKKETSPQRGQRGKVSVEENPSSSHSRGKKWIGTGYLTAKVERRSKKNMRNGDVVS